MNLRYRNERAPLSESKASTILIISVPDWIVSSIARTELAADRVPAILCVPQDASIIKADTEQPIGVQEAVWGRSGLEGPGLNQRQKVLYGMGAVMLRYIWARADQAVASQHWGDEPRR